MGYCCNQVEIENRVVRLKFKREELLYDVKNYSYIEGEVLGEEKQHAQHTLVEIGEEGNVDRVSRILAVVFSAVIEMLYPYTKQEPVEEEIDDVLWSPEEYVFEMNVPTTMSRTTIFLLKDLIHEYMVYRVMHDWLSMTNKNAAADWLAKAEDVKKQIEEAKNQRRGVLTRRCSPVW